VIFFAYLLFLIFADAVWEYRKKQNL
jgi:hypothetical protein